MASEGRELGFAALGGCGFNRTNVKFGGKPRTVLTHERKVRLLLEYQFDFIIFLFVSIVYPALSHRTPPPCQWTLSVSLSS